MLAVCSQLEVSKRTFWGLLHIFVVILVSTYGFAGLFELIYEARHGTGYEKAVTLP